jgi:hypothetical protein
MNKTNNNSLTTVLLLLLLSTLTLCASRRLTLPAAPLQNPGPKMSISQAIAYLDNLVSTIQTSRTKLTPKMPNFRFDATPETPKLDNSKTNEAIATVMDGLNTFKENFGDFFEADKIKDTLQYLEDNSYDLFNTGKQATTDSMNNLGTGLRRMIKIKNTVTVMLTGIKGGADLVSGVFKKWKEHELKDEQQQKIYMVGLKSLDKTLLAALTTCGELKGDLYDVADLMGKTQVAFESLKADFQRAATEPMGEAQQSFFGAFIKNSVVGCIVPCAMGTFSAFFGDFGGLATCTACVASGLVATIKAEQNRVAGMIPKNTEMMNKFKDAMDTMVGFSKTIGETATKQAEAVNAFQTDLANMEIDLTNTMD